MWLRLDTVVETGHMRVPDQYSLVSTDNVREQMIDCQICIRQLWGERE